MEGHSVDVTGERELKISEMYISRAELAEAEGYIGLSMVCRKIANSYVMESEENRKYYRITE